MKNTYQSDVIQDTAHVRGHGKNFKPLVAAGSWTICGFTYGRSKCACCGRPIVHVLHLKNESHDANNGFPETIHVGIVCGPKVFTESCVGFYDDPSREWERQHRAWKEYITYVVLCVKHDALWGLVPVELRDPVDAFLQAGQAGQDHSGAWWMVRDAKKRFLRCQRQAHVMPKPNVLYAASRSLVYAAKKNSLLTQACDLKCDWDTGRLWIQEAAA